MQPVPNEPSPRSSLVGPSRHETPSQADDVDGATREVEAMPEGELPDLEPLYRLQLSYVRA